ncbi:MIP family channel protein [Candidatus Ruminimicrobium bovinum]|uniref:MIP family channel protein n=1 Tax=Candidatus Ruminimicrobium bovinum TaxID=3242779 RepID=UPI0039B94B40
MKKYVAEFTGTLFLVFIACGVAAVSGCKFPEAGYIATALAFGLTIVAMAYSIGNVSGCHVNPAVSVGVCVAGKMTVAECVKYIISQFLGAICGAILLGICLGNFSALGANGFGGVLANGTTVTAGMAIIVEIILTFAFVLAILGVTDKEKNASVAGLVIGLTLVVIHLIGIPFTGTSVNPARSFGPALFQGGQALAQVWVFIIAPAIGGALAGVFYKAVLKENK